LEHGTLSCQPVHADQDEVVRVDPVEALILLEVGGQEQPAHGIINRLGCKRLERLKQLGVRHFVHRERCVPDGGFADQPVHTLVPNEGEGLDHPRVALHVPMFFE